MAMLPPPITESPPERCVYRRGETIGRPPRHVDADADAVALGAAAPGAVASLTAVPARLPALPAEDGRPESDFPRTSDWLVF